MTFAWDNRVKGMTEPQALQARGEHNLYFQVTDPPLYKCCPSPRVADSQQCGRSSDDTADANNDVAWIYCAGGFIGDEGLFCVIFISPPAAPVYYFLKLYIMNSPYVLSRTP